MGKIKIILRTELLFLLKISTGIYFVSFLFFLPWRQRPLYTDLFLNLAYREKGFIFGRGC